VFSGFTLPIDRVMARGEWLVIDGRHKDVVEARAGYSAVARNLYRDEMAS